MGAEDIQVYNQRLDANCTNFQAGPVEGRSCTEWGCIIAFILIFVATFGGGAYFIVQGKDNIATMIANS